MGYELTRFQGEVDEELVCPICAGVLEEPLQVSNCHQLLRINLRLDQKLTICVRLVVYFKQAAVCEHAFCRACITEWLSRQPTCPVDRNSITTSNLRPVPRILKNLLAR